MTAADHNAALALWQITEGLGLGPSDTGHQVASFLARNPGLSFVAEAGGELVGTALCGSDGRRGFIYHLAVARSHRGLGLGRAIVEHCLAGLRQFGLTRCHIIVFAHNAEGRRFWAHLGFGERPELLLCSRDLPS